jgi:hypothetical protein
MIIRFYNEDEEHLLKVNFAKIGSIETYDVTASGEVFDKRALLRFYVNDKIYVVNGSNTNYNRINQGVYVFEGDLATHLWLLAYPETLYRFL